MQELSQKEQRVEEKLDQQIYKERMFIKYTQDQALFNYKQYELEDAHGRIQDLESQMDRLMLDDNEKANIIEVLQRENDLFKGETRVLVESLNN